jgi:hypothetical protein
MSRLSDAMREKEMMRARYDETKHEVVEAALEFIEERGRCYAREVADEAGRPTREIIGVLQSAEYHGILTSRRSKRENVYVRLRPDGTVDMNDKVICRYSANTYELRQR